MAFGTATFSGLGTAVSDIGAGISAEGAATSDLYAAEAEQYKIEGTQFEKASYQEAAALAGQNEQFTAISTRIKAAQAQRELSMSLGTTKANVAGAGLAESGSSLDILRESASQGALTRAVIKSQGLITEAGYKQQQQSYLNMVGAANAAITGDTVARQADLAAAGTANKAATFDFVGAAIAGAGALFSLAPTPTPTP
jgi:hypothetical protein